MRKAPGFGRGFVVDPAVLIMPDGGKLNRQVAGQKIAFRLKGLVGFPQGEGVDIAWVNSLGNGLGATFIHVDVAPQKAKIRAGIGKMRGFFAPLRMTPQR